jgi:hypothetical protein
MLTKLIISKTKADVIVGLSGIDADGFVEIRNSQLILTGRVV